MLERGVQKIQFSYFCVVTSYLAAKLIEERRGMGVEKSVCSPELFIVLEACWTCSLSDTGNLLHDCSSFVFLLLEFMPNAR